MPSYQAHHYHRSKGKKVALLTRAVNGIGYAIAIEFARAGYHIVINDSVERDLYSTVGDLRSVLAENANSKGLMNGTDLTNYISYFAGDISKEEVSVSLIKDTIKKFGWIDVLINNAMISQQSIASQSYEMSAAGTRTNANGSTNHQELGNSSPYFTLEEYGIVDTSLKDIYFCIRELVKHLLIYKNPVSGVTNNKSVNKTKIDTIKKDNCSIINISSCYNSIPTSQVAAYTVSQSGIDPFTSSRQSVKSLTESVALQLAGVGVRVNAISPGFIDSEISNELTTETKKRVEHTIPLQRIGQATEIARVALFLASEATSYVTGTMIYVDGGLSLRGSNWPTQ